MLCRSIEGRRSQLAEVFAAMDRKDEATALIAQAVRDINWLERSPFFKDLARSSAWLELEDRIARELNAQRRLTEGDTKLALAINS